MRNSMIVLGLVAANTVLAVEVRLGLIPDKAAASTSYCPTVSPGPNVCARACGPGNVKCVTDHTCYNPSAGEVCCEDGHYCPLGYRCIPGACCANNATLAECRASHTISTLPPPKSSSSSSSSSVSPVGPTAPPGTPPGTIPPGTMPPGTQPPGNQSTIPVGPSSPSGSPSPATTPITPEEPPNSAPSVGPSGGGIPGGGVQYCQPVENPTCERSCGPGWTVCQVYPNCYNPGQGQQCCSDGSYCLAGTHCIPGGCCKDGETCPGSSAAGGVTQPAYQAPSSHAVAPGVSQPGAAGPSLTITGTRTLGGSYIGGPTTSTLYVGGSASSTAPSLATATRIIADAAAAIVVGIGIAMF